MTHHYWQQIYEYFCQRSISILFCFVFFWLEYFKSSNSKKNIWDPIFLEDMNRPYKQYLTNSIKLHETIDSPRMKSYDSSSFKQLYINPARPSKDKKTGNMRHCRMKTADLPTSVSVSNHHNTIDSLVSNGMENRKKYSKNQGKTKVISNPKVISLKVAKSKKHKTHSALQVNTKNDLSLAYKNCSTVLMRNSNGQQSSNNLTKGLKNKKKTMSMESLLSRLHEPKHKTEEKEGNNPQQTLQRNSQYLNSFSVTSKLKQPNIIISEYENINRKLISAIENNKREYTEKLKQRSEIYQKKEKKLILKVNQMQQKNTRLVSLVNYMKKTGINTDQYWQQMYQKKQ